VGVWRVSRGRSFDHLENDLLIPKREDLAEKVQLRTPNERRRTEILSLTATARCGRTTPRSQQILCLGSYRCSTVSDTVRPAIRHQIEVMES